MGTQEHLNEEASLRVRVTNGTSHSGDGEGLSSTPSPSLPEGWWLWNLTKTEMLELHKLAHAKSIAELRLSHHIELLLAKRGIDEPVNVDLETGEIKRKTNHEQGV